MGGMIQVRLDVARQNSVGVPGSGPRRKPTDYHGLPKLTVVVDQNA